MLVTICLIGLVYFNARRNDSTALAVEDTYSVIAAIDAAYASVVDMQNGYRGFLLSGDIAYLDPYYAAAAQFPTQMVALRSLAHDDATRLERWNAVDQAVGRWTRDVAEPGIALRRQLIDGPGDAGDDAVPAGTASRDGEEIIAGIRETLNDALAVERVVLAQRLDARAAADSQLHWFTGAGMVLAALVGLVCAVGLNRELGRPLDQLASASQRLAAGQFDQRVATNRGDEFGLTAIAFNMMAARLQTVFTDLEATAATATSNQLHIQAVMDSVTDGIMTFDDRGRILSSNPAIEAMFGYESIDLIGLPVTSLLPGGVAVDDTGKVVAPGTGNLKIGVGQEVRGRFKDGGTFPVEFVVSHLRSNGQKRFIGVVREISDRKHAEAAVHESWQRYRDLFQEAERQARELSLLDEVRTALAKELDLDTIFRTVVQSTARTLGFTHVSVYELDGETLRLRHHLGYATVLAEVSVGESVLGRVVTSGEPIFLEDVSVDPTFLGAVKDIVSEIAVPILDGDRVVAVLNVESVDGHRLSRDDLDLVMAVTSQVNIAVSRARLHQEVQDREAYFRSLVQNGSDLIMVMTGDGRVNYVSPASERLIGTNQLSTIGERIRNFVVPEDEPALEDAMGKASLTPGVTVRVPLRVRLGDGQVRSLETLVTNRVDDPNVGGFIFNSRDVTERREAEAALVEQARRAEQARGETNAILDASSEAMILIAPDGRVVSANRRFGELFDQDIVGLSGQSMHDVRADMERAFTDSDRLLTILRSTLGDVSSRVTEILTQKYPEHRELALFSSPVLTSDGEHLGRLFAFRDVTREREVDRMKTEFVSLVSHELRTPLTSIKGYVDLLMEGEVGPLSDDQREFLGIVVSNAERLVALINDLLDISRIEAGRVELQRLPVDFSRVVSGVLTSLRPQIEAKGQRIEIAVPPALPPIDGDLDRLIQILTNLVANAHKYTPAGGTITIAARATPGTLQFSVADDGIGMTDEEQAQLFTKFFRARNRTTQEVGGTGLGLTITRSLVELHGGDITVTSTPDTGTTFSVTLPTSRGTTASLVFPDVATSPGGTILVVEDDIDIANLVRRYLERAGYSVLNAGTAQDALAIARDFRPDLITLDVMLPTHNGFTLLGWLKDDPTTREIPVMILSMMPDDGHGRERGAVDYMVKPVHERALLTRVNRLMTLPASLSRILIIDASDSTHQTVRAYLAQSRISVSNARDMDSAAEWMDRHTFDAILIDGRFLDGIALTHQLGTGHLGDPTSHPQLVTTPIVLLTNRDTVDAAASEDAAGDAANNTPVVPSLRQRLNVVATLQRPVTEASFTAAISRAGIDEFLFVDLVTRGASR